MGSEVELWAMHQESYYLTVTLVLCDPGQVAPRL